MLANVFLGIKLGLLFPEQGPGFWHFIYYIAMVAGFIWVCRHVIAKWKKLPKFYSDKKGSGVK